MSSYVKIFLQNIPRRNFKDRRDAGGGVLFADTPTMHHQTVFSLWKVFKSTDYYFSVIIVTNEKMNKRKFISSATIKEASLLNPMTGYITT